MADNDESKSSETGSISKFSRELTKWDSIICLATLVLTVVLLIVFITSMYNTGGIPILHGIHLRNLEKISEPEAFTIKNPVTKRLNVI